MPLLGALVFLVGSVAAAGAVTMVRGTLIEQHGDTLQGAEVDRSFIVQTAHGDVRLADQQPSSLDGQQVTVTDTAPSRRGLEGQARPVNADETLQASPPPGPQTVLVLILTTPDDPTPAVPDVATARAQIFTNTNSTAAFYAQQSNGATTLVGRLNANGDVLGPIALSTSMTGCPYSDISTEADQKAMALGYTTSSYDHVIYLMPHSGQCAWAGLGDLPGHDVWSNGYTFSAVLSHELGHNMGAHHANLDTCTTATGAPAQYSATCTSTEYGDPFDVMGGSGALMGAFHRLQIGELPASEVVSLHQSAAVPVVSSDLFAPPGPRLVLVPIKVAHQPVHDYFAIDTRSPLTPFDFWLAGSAVTKGLTIRKVNDSTGAVLQTQLLNMHPVTQTPPDIAQSAPLQPDETFTDAADNISITAGTDATGGLQATVSMRTLVDDVPPTPPTGLMWSGNSASVHLSWTAGTDDVAVDHYTLTRDGVPLGTTTGLTFDDPNVQSLTQMAYAVSTVDTSGNVSTPATVTATPADVTPPTPPLGLQAQRNADGSATLTWTAGTDNRGVIGYRITEDASALTFAQSTTLKVFPDARSHTYAVYTRDAAGNESTPATIGLPAAPPPPAVAARPPPPPPPTCVVPQVGARLSLAMMQQSLQAAHCTGGQLRYAASRTVPQGDVVGLSPAPGTQLASGASVDVVLSTGAPCIVPSFRPGATRASVQHALGAAHCSVGRTSSGHSSRVRKGRVLALFPSPGTQLGSGASVGIRVSSGPRRH